MTLRWRRMLRIALELGVGFGALWLLDVWTTGGTGFVRLDPNPFWLPVLVMALAYGTGPGLVAAALASTVWLAHVGETPGMGDYLDHLFRVSVQPLLWFVAAVAIGEVTMMRIARHARLEKRGGTAARNVARLTEAFDRLSKTNRTLQVQVATDERTLGHVVATASRLSSSDTAPRRAAIVRLVAMAARTEDFTCYRLVGGEARAWLCGDGAVGHEIASGMLLDRLRERDGIVHAARQADRDALDGIGVAAIALHAETGDLVGCLVLHSLPFAALGPHRLAELTEIGVWLAPLLVDPPRGDQRAMRPGLVA